MTFGEIIHGLICKNRENDYITVLDRRGREVTFGQAYYLTKENFNDALAKVIKAEWDKAAYDRYICDNRWNVTIQLLIDY